MNDLQVFKNDEFGQIRTVDIDGQIWFVGKDVATALGYSNTSDALGTHIDDDDKKMGSENATPYITDTLGRKQYPLYINESGLYALVLGSRLKGAKKFKKWITAEVIPSIRKNGGYIANQENMSPAEIVANALIVANNIIADKDRQIEDLESERDSLLDENEELLNKNSKYIEDIENMQPQIDYLELICKSPEILNTTQIAAEYGMQPAEFNKLLHKLGFIKKTNKTWVPTAKIADKGYMMPSTYEYDKENHKTKTRFTWNQEGRKAIYFLLAKNGIYPIKERNQRYIQMTLDI